MVIKIIAIIAILLIFGILGHRIWDLNETIKTLMAPLAFYTDFLLQEHGFTYNDISRFIDEKIEEDNND